MFRMEDTIVARATAPGAAAISVIRISGSHTFQLCEALTRGKIQDIPTHTLKLRTFYTEDKVADQGLIAFFGSPNSFTGEDMAELYLHGSEFITKSVIEFLLNKGARLADRGEFTMRAYMNGKMDLAQAEAVADVISAGSSAAHGLAMKQLKGGVSRKIDGLRARILEFAALIELELDFGEEDVEFADRAQLVTMVEGLMEEVGLLLNSFKTGNAIKEGIPVAIVGKPNAGKSTLLNLLLGEERAIVTAIAGTTRDTIEEKFVFNGVEFRLIDTAGIRETLDEVEAIGVDRALKSAKTARLVWLLYDASEGFGEDDTSLRTALSEQSEAEIWKIANKVDLLKGYDGKDIAISAATGDVTELTIALQKFTERLLQHDGDVTITHYRHYDVLGKVLVDLNRISETIQAKRTGDMLAFDLRNAMGELGKITGAIDSEEVLGEIFGKFCIGK